MRVMIGRTPPACGLVRMRIRSSVVALLAVLALALAACGSQSSAEPTPSATSAVGSSSTLAVGTADTSPATPVGAAPSAGPAVSAVPVPSPVFPGRWVGVVSDGVTVTVRGVDGGEIAEVEVPVAVGEGGTSVVRVLMQDGAVVVDTCCEPAAGRWLRWLVGSGDLVEGAWFGEVTDVDAAGRLLAADPNGFVVRAAAPNGGILVEWRSVADGEPAVAPEDAAWSPDGSLVAFVGVDPAGETVLATFGVEAVGLGDAVVVDRGPADGVHPAFPTVDRRGRVWYVLVDETSRIPTAAGGLAPETVGGRIVDGDTGEVVDKVFYDGTVVDQHFDASGSFLIVTYADGRVVWRSIDGTDSGTLAEGGYAAADW